MNLFNLLLKLQGFDIDKSQMEIDRLKLMTNEDFFNWQDEAKWNIFEFHKSNNKLYSEWLGHKEIINWKDVPIMTKESIQKPLEVRLSEGYNKNNIFVNHTSGSTGIPFYFAKDKFSHSITWSVIREFYSFHSIDIYKDRQARFYGLPFTSVAKFKERFKDLIMNRYRFNVFDPSDAVQYHNLNILKSGNYDYINGYTRSLTVFAKYLKRNNLFLKQLCPRLKAIIVTSGMLSEDDKNLMKETFQIPVINEYGASELSLIAFENKNFNWIINDYEIYIEVVDDNGEIVDDGVTGRILITSLWNRAMPFIRYEIGDVGAVSKSKDERFRILNSLVGRSNDYMIMKDGTKSSVAVLEHVIKPILKNNYDLKEYIIRQWQVDKFTFEYISEKLIDEKISIMAAKELNKMLGYNVSFDLIKRDKLERTSGWKLKYFERMF